MKIGGITFLKLSIASVLTSLALLVQCGGVDFFARGSQGSAGLYPAPGNSGFIAVTKNGTSVTLKWAPGSDEVSAESALKYKIFQSELPNIEKLENVANGNEVLAWTFDPVLVRDGAFLTYTFTAADTYKYFNIIVCNERGYEASYTMVGVISPVPGDNGWLFFKNLTQNSVTIEWTPASDDQTAPSGLQYKIIRSAAAITTIADFESATDIVAAWTANISSINATGLTTATPYYFTVAVKDQDGNMALYGSKVLQTTLAADAPAISDYAISIPSITSTGEPDFNYNVQVSWTAPAGSDIDYQVRYQEGGANVPTIDWDREAGSAAGSWVTGNTTNITLPDAKTYYINLVVRKENFTYTNVGNGNGSYTFDGSTYTDVGTGNGDYSRTSTYSYAIYNLTKRDISQMPDISPPNYTDGRIVVSDITTSSMKITWQVAVDEYAPGSEEYRVYYSSTESNMNSVAAITSAATPVTGWFNNAGPLISQSITGLVAGTDYWVNVLVRDNLHNTRSYTKKFSPTNHNLAPTVNPNYALTYTGITNKKITVNWTAATGSSAKYKVYRASGNTIDTISIASSATQVTTDWITDVFYEDTGISPGETRWYTVVAGYNDGGTYRESIYNMSSAKTGTLSAGTATKNSVALNFTRGFNGSDADADLRYQIGYKISTDPIFTYLGWSSSYGTSAVVSSLNGDTSYDFTIRIAKFDNPNTYVEYDPVSQSTLPPPYLPANININIDSSGATGSKEVTLSWGATETWNASTKAFDYSTITYKIYHSSSNNINSVSDITTNGTQIVGATISDPASPSSTVTLSSYSSGATCYINILVTDSSNSSERVYAMRSVLVP